MPEEPTPFDDNYQSESESFTLDQEPEKKRLSFTRAFAYLMLAVGLLAGIGLYLLSLADTPALAFIPTNSTN